MCLSASNWEMELRAMQKVAIKVLSGEEVSEDVYRSLQKFVKEEGVNALFYDQDEWFPTGDDDTGTPSTSSAELIAEGAIS